MAAGTSLVVVTHGINGAQAWHTAAGQVKVEAPTIDVVDTIGAGDSFQAALLFALRAIGRIKSAALAQVNAGELDRALSFAAACAAFTCSRAGADPPRHSDIGPALSRLFAG
jgi:fructokinase